jgi:hypothetical protein
MKLKTFFTTEEMVSKLKRLPTEWESFCQLWISQGIDNQNIQRSQKAKLPKINDPMKKWAKELNRAFSKEEI